MPQKLFYIFFRLVKNSDFVGIGVDSLSIELGRTQVGTAEKNPSDFQYFFVKISMEWIDVMLLNHRPVMCTEPSLRETE